MYKNCSHNILLTQCTYYWITFQNVQIMLHLMKQLEILNIQHQHYIVTVYPNQVGGTGLELDGIALKVMQEYNFLNTPFVETGVVLMELGG